MPSSTSPRVLARLQFIHRLTAILIAGVILSISEPRAETGIDLQSLAYSAAKPTTELILCLPDFRGKSPASVGWIKLTLIPVFCGKIHATSLDHPLALARLVPPAHSASPPAPSLVGTIELRI